MENHNSIYVKNFTKKCPNFSFFSLPPQNSRSQSIVFLRADVFILFTLIIDYKLMAWYTLVNYIITFLVNTRYAIISQDY